MAYVDKVTRMRRLALIWAGYKQDQSNGAIVWEGVNIEDIIVIKEVNGNKINRFDLDIDEDIKKFSGFMMGNHLELIYQDPETDERWEPRLSAVNGGE